MSKKKEQRAIENIRLEDIPLYKPSLDYTTAVLKLVQHFDRNYKFSLGSHLSDCAIELLALLPSAFVENDLEERLRLIRQMYLNKMKINMAINQAFNLKLLSPKELAMIAIHSQEVEIQLGGWIRKTKDLLGAQKARA